MLKKSKQLLSLCFFSLVLICTILIIFKDVSLSAIVDVIFSVNPIFILIGFMMMMMMIFIACDTIKISIILKKFNQPISIRNACGYTFIGFYFSTITPSATGGQPAQMYDMSKDNIQISYSSITLLIITILYQAITIFYDLILLCFNYSFVMQHLGN